jgi:hypothetical protein
MIERLHRQLKGALIRHPDEHWTEALQLVLIGIRTVLKDLKVSSIEFVYGSPVRLSGALFIPFPAECTDVTDFHTEKLLPILVSRHVAPSTFISKDLATAPYVFLRQGALWEALQTPYVGPYKALHRGHKTYSIEVPGAATTVSIDRMKPANILHVNTESASQSAIPSIITICSGRPGCFPDFLECSGLRRRAGGVADAND